MITHDITREEKRRARAKEPVVSPGAGGEETAPQLLVEREESGHLSGGGEHVLAESGRVGEESGERREARSNGVCGLLARGQERETE